MAVGRKSPRLSQLYFGKTVVEDTPSMRYEVILFIILFFYYYLGPLLPLSRYSGHRRSEVVPSTVKGKSKASLDHHSLLLTIGIGACTYPLN